MKSTREEVFNAISRERDYQNAMGSPDATMGEFILYLEHYVSAARTTLTIGGGNGRPEFYVKDTMRKIAALAVAAMEQHGALERQEA